MFAKTPIGITNWRDSNREFYIKDSDRFAHIYVVGKTGVGKSTLLLNMALSDIDKGKGLCVIDPHSDVVEKLLEYIPEHRISDVLYFNPTDTDYPVGLNPLKSVIPQFHDLVASGLISVFKKIWADSWGVRMEYILRFSILTLLEYPEATLLDINPLLTNPIFRKEVLNHVKNEHTRSFWFNEFDTYTKSHRNEAISPILNKAGIFHTNDVLRNIFGQRKQKFRISQIMDTSKIMLVNLSKGELGEDITGLLGSMLITSFQLATSYRATQDESERTGFTLYIDEAHSFITTSFVDILAEARKYKLSLFLSHQYIDQLHEKIQSAIFGNVGTMIAFRVGATDAKILEQEFYPICAAEDFIKLPRFGMYIKLMIDGATSFPFSAYTLPHKLPAISHENEIIAYSQKTYGVDKSTIENHIHDCYFVKNKQVFIPDLFNSDQN